MTTELEALRAFHRSFQGAGTKSLASLTEERLTLWHDAREAGEKAALSAAKSAPPEAQVERLGKRCIDGGKCHHECDTSLHQNGRCFRRECCQPFSDYKGPWEYDNDAPLLEVAKGGDGSFIVLTSRLKDLPAGTRFVTATPPREVAAIEPVAWAGCGECDCVFKCYGGAARCIRLVAESPTPQDGAVEPAGYIYEWDIPLGRHQKLEDSPYNGSRPHRSYPYYTHAESPSLPVSAMRLLLQE